ncbi:MAG: acyl-CoA dehydrogenase family protein [Elusimicrobia bacterium]|nr:acyl-CoA dehydrogenase family protein [Elusimicrobiota bacterium]
MRLLLAAALALQPLAPAFAQLKAVAPAPVVVPAVPTPSLSPRSPSPIDANRVGVRGLDVLSPLTPTLSPAARGRGGSIAAMVPAASILPLASAVKAAALAGAPAAEERPSTQDTLRAAALAAAKGDASIGLPRVYDRAAFGTGAPEDAGTAMEKEAKELRKTLRKPEALIPHFYRGGLPLNELSKIPSRLEPAKQERIDAYKELIRAALRPKGLPAADEARAAAVLDSPSPAVKAWLDELGVDGAQLKTPILDAHQIDQDNDIPPEVFARAASLGLLRLKIPKEYGGLGLHQMEYGQVLEVFPHLSTALGSAISAHSTIGSAPLIMFGTEEQKKKYFGMFVRGSALAAFGLTEPKAGTDLNKLGTTATLSPDGKTWKVTGEKIFITGIMDAGLVYLVTGKSIVDGKDVGPSVLAIELPFLANETWAAKKAKLAALDEKGMRITPFTRDGLEMMMIRGTDQGFIQLRDFEVPAENVLGPRGQGKMVPLVSLNKGRAGFGPYVTAAAQWFGDRASQWAVDREMFDMYAAKKGGTGLQGDMESVATRLGRLRMTGAALEAVSDLTSALIDANPDMGVAALSAAIKVRVSEEGWKAAQDAAELGGGHALIKGAPNGVERAFRDAWIARIVEGVNPAMAQFVHLIGGMRVQREVMTPLGMIGFALRQVRNRATGIIGFSERGVLSRESAQFLQSRTARFAFRFSATAAAVGAQAWLADMWRRKRLILPLPRTMQRYIDESFGRRQNTLIRAYEVVMDLFTLTAVELRLAREGKTLPPLDGQALEAAVLVLRLRIDRNLSYLRPGGEPIENIEAALGRAVVAEQRSLAPSRESTVERHMDFLHAEADAFYRKLDREPWPAVESPAPAPPAKQRSFLQPKPNRFVMWFLGHLNRWVLLKGVPVLRHIPIVRDLPGVHGWFWIRSFDVPQADRDRLGAAVNPDTAAFLGPNHPEFGTDWMVDKEISTFVAPQMASWADRGVVRGAPWLWLRNNLISNDGGDEAKEYSVRSAIAGKGTLLHTEGTVYWTNDYVHELFPGIAQMAARAARRTEKPVYIVPLVWKYQFTGDVSRRIRREMGILERALGLAGGASLDIPARFEALQEGILERQAGRFGFALPSGGGFFARQRAFQSWLLEDLESRHDSDPALSAEGRILRLSRAIRITLSALDGDESPAANARREELKADLRKVNEARRLGEFAPEVYGGERLTQEQLFESLKRNRDRLVKGGLLDTIAKFLPRPFGPRIVRLGVPEAIRVTAVPESETKAYEARLLHEARRRMQEKLDEINRRIAPETARTSVPNPFR